MSDDFDRKFIEYDLPLAEISHYSGHESNVHIGRPHQFHVWWARRTLAASRATTFASLIDDPGCEESKERNEINRLIGQISNWNEVKDGNSQRIERARRLIAQANEDSPPKIYDPFAGGGSIPLEAIRLGCDTYLSDYNPVSTLLLRATVEWPQKFAFKLSLPNDFNDPTKSKDCLLEDSSTGSSEQNFLVEFVDRRISAVLKEAEEQLQEFYPEETKDGLKAENDPAEDNGWIPVSYIWAREIPCQNPNCHASIPLISQYWLSKSTNKKVAYRPVVNSEKETVDFRVISGNGLQAEIDKGFDPSKGTVSDGNAECLLCEQVTAASDVRKLGCTGKMKERIVAVVLHHPDDTGKKYRSASSSDRQVVKRAESMLESEVENWPFLESPLPEEEIPLMSGTFNAPLYGLDQWKDLFNPRQKLVLVTLSRLIREETKEIESECNYLCSKLDGLKVEDSEELSTAIVGYLALWFDKILDFSSRLCGWKTRSELSDRTLKRKALPMTWDYSEVNPFSGSTGSGQKQLYYIRKSLEKFSVNPGNVPTIYNVSASDVPVDDNSMDAVITDPPYYNNVPYADLSDYFYVWLKRAIGSSFPKLFSTPLVPKRDEATEMAGWDSERYGYKDKEFFENKLEDAFSKAWRILKPGGIAVIVYAHKETEGWESMLQALAEAGFVVTASWPIHSEMKARLRAAQSAALASSIYMVCRKVEREKVGFWNDVQKNVRKRIKEKLTQFWDAGVVGGDFFISAIGPGMEAYSCYERVETYDGDEVTVLDLLQFIRAEATDFLVNHLLKDASATQIDKEAQFYLTYRWTFMEKEDVEFDDVRKIANAEGVDLKQLDGDDTFLNARRKYVSLYGPHQRDEINSIENMVDAMHVACRLWANNEQEELNKVLEHTGYGDSGAFWQFCQAVSESLENGMQEKKWLEGLLMTKDRHQEEPTTEQASLNIEELTDSKDD